MNENQESYFDAHIRATLGDFYPMLSAMQWMIQNRRIDQCVYARLPYELYMQ